MVARVRTYAAAFRAGARSLYERVHPEPRELARLRRADVDQFQPWTLTAENRHPRLFRLLAESLADTEPQRILSFGCSSGEEVRSIRAYCPRALITGIDCNRRALARARRSDDSALSTYIEGDRPDPSARYDAVLALAVFRHGALSSARSSTSCEALIPFERVDAAVARLDTVLAPGGWLAWANNQFRFEDMQAARSYAPAIFAGTRTKADPLFGRDNRLIEISSRTPLLYRKIG